jgi:hypothetical protein
MKSLQSRVKLLQRRAKDMASLAARLERKRGKVPDWVGDRRDEIIVEASFQAAFAVAQLQEIEPAFQAFFGPDPSTADRVLIDIPELSTEVIERAFAKVVSRFILKSFSQMWESDPFEAMVGDREFVAITSLLDSRDLARAGHGGKISHSGSFEERLASLSDDEQRGIRVAVRDYLANQWIYPWARTRFGERLSARYESLFKVAQVPYGDANVFEADILKRLARRGSLNDNDLGILAGVLESIARAISEYGLDALSDILASGGDPLVGRHACVGVIPGESAGPCPRILVAIATTKSSRSRFGAIPVIRKMREALISCCDGSGAHPRTEVAIFVGPLDSIEGVIEESAGDIERHLSKGTLKVFIPVGVLRDRMNVIEWR